MSRFYPNLKITMRGNKIISRQRGSTPGIYKIFTLKPKTQYMIKLIDYQNGLGKQVLWISTPRNKTLMTQPIRSNEFMYYNQTYERLKIGVIFKNTQRGHHFYLNDILLIDLNEKQKEKDEKLIDFDEINIEKEGDIDADQEDNVNKTNLQHKLLDLNDIVFIKNPVEQQDQIREDANIDEKCDKIDKNIKNVKNDDLKQHIFDKNKDENKENRLNKLKKRQELLEQQRNKMFELRNQIVDEIKKLKQELIDVINVDGVQLNVNNQKNNELNTNKNELNTDKSELNTDKIELNTNKSVNYVKNMDNVNKNGVFFEDKSDIDINMSVNQNNIVKNKTNKLKISVIIPCHYLHFKHISGLIENYELQTRIPDELIIVISEYHKIKSGLIDEIENKDYKINVILIKIEEKSPAGNNRYIGTEKAVGDIIIFQDADDLAHFQRVEIIEYLFKRYENIVHICHGYTEKNTVVKYKIKYVPHGIYKHNMFRNHKEMSKYNMTNGNIAIRKNIYDKIEWVRDLYRAQDVPFNRNIFKIYGKFLLIKVPLYIYRKRYSLRDRINKS